MPKPIYYLYSVKKGFHLNDMSFTKKRVESNLWRKIASLPEKDLILTRSLDPFEDIARDIGRDSSKTFKLHSFNRDTFIDLTTRLLETNQSFDIQFTDEGDQDFFSPELDEFNHMMVGIRRKELGEDSHEDIVNSLSYLLKDYGVEISRYHLNVTVQEKTYKCSFLPSSALYPPEHDIQMKGYPLPLELQDEIAVQAYTSLVRTLYPHAEMCLEVIPLKEKEMVLHALHHSYLVLQTLLSHTPISQLSQELNLPSGELEIIVDCLLSEAKSYENQYVYKN